MHSRVLAVIRKETREVLRDPIYLVLAIAVPIVVTTLLALGFVLDVKNLPVAFYDQDRSPLSREYMYSFTNSEYFRLVTIVNSEAELDHLIESAAVRAAVVVPPDFSRRLSGGQPATVQVLVDGSFPSRALVASGYIAAIDAQFSAAQRAGFLARQGLNQSSVAPVTVEGRVWFNPSLETKNSLVPGLMVISLMFYPGLLAALVVVREKERGTILNLYCSPVRRWEVIAGKAVPYIALAFVVYLLLFALNLYVFHVRFVGNPFVLTAAALLYIAASVGFGLVISVFSSTQVGAMLVTFIGLMTPSILFSGLMTPVSSMEPSAQFISRLIPASYFIAMVRGVYLKGLGFRDFAHDLLTLFIFAAAVYCIAIAGFRKKAG
ncbi:MAG TPA: ABC transporter permease [Vicinamibacterales bacterium]|nr:ABC transporter permease [Vicinamibacterales bacterium]